MRSANSGAPGMRDNEGSVEGWGREGGRLGPQPLICHYSCTLTPRQVSVNTAARPPGVPSISLVANPAIRQCHLRQRTSRRVGCNLPSFIFLWDITPVTCVCIVVGFGRYRLVDAVAIWDVIDMPPALLHSLLSPVLPLSMVPDIMYRHHSPAADVI